MAENTTPKKYLSFDGLAEYDGLIKNKIETGFLAVNGGGTLTLDEIFGTAPYAIEATSEEENFSASDMDYDNSNSGLSSTNVQGAIDELKVLTETVPAGTDYSTYRVRNIAILDAVPTTMNDGDIALVYHKEG